MKNASDSFLRKIVARTLALLLILSLGCSVAEEDWLPPYEEWTDDQIIAMLDFLFDECDYRGIIYTPPSEDRVADFDVWDESEETTGFGVQHVEGGGVWVPTNGGSKYHAKPDCSGMVDPVETTEESAVSCGFGPCRRCYKYK